MRLGAWEIALILVIVLIVFGVGKLPQVARELGKGIHLFRRASRGEDEEEETKPKGETTEKVTKEGTKQDQS
jgi:sec-independent protein translocase protein TatA